MEAVIDLERASYVGKPDVAARTNGVRKKRCIFAHCVICVKSFFSLLLVATAVEAMRAKVTHGDELVRGRPSDMPRRRLSRTSSVLEGAIYDLNKKLQMKRHLFAHGVSWPHTETSRMPGLGLHQNVDYWINHKRHLPLISSSLISNKTQRMFKDQVSVILDPDSSNTFRTKHLRDFYDRPYHFHAFADCMEDIVSNIGRREAWRYKLEPYPSSLPAWDPKSRSFPYHRQVMQSSVLCHQNPLRGPPAVGNQLILNPNWLPYIEDIDDELVRGDMILPDPYVYAEPDPLASQFSVNEHLADWTLRHVGAILVDADHMTSRDWDIVQNSQRKVSDMLEKPVPLVTSSYQRDSSPIKLFTLV